MTNPAKNRRLSRWDLFVLSVFLIYTAECFFLLHFADTVPKFIATVMQLFLVHQFGKYPRRVPVGLYSLFLPLVLFAGVAGSYMARPNAFEFPTMPFMLSWLLMQFPVIIWCRKQPSTSGRAGLLPMLYVLSLFLAYFWRLASTYSTGSFVHYEYTPAYTWMCFILPQMVCCSASTRRLIRVALTCLNWKRTLASVLVGLGLITVWDLLSAVLFRLAGLSVTIMILGPTVPTESYANPLVAIADHLMLITGTYIYVALPEEVFFRLILPGLLVDKLRARGVESFWTSFVLSAFIFGSVHWLQASPMWTKVLYSFVSGLVFATLRRFSRNIQAPAAVHAITNDMPRLIWS